MITYEISSTTTNLDSYNQPSSGELAVNPVVTYKLKILKCIQNQNQSDLCLNASANQTRTESRSEFGLQKHESIHVKIGVPTATLGKYIHTYIYSNKDCMALFSIFLYWFQC